MGLFKRRPSWTPAEIPDLSFDGPTEYVDIGFLGGDGHRDAFASIFGKMLKDNAATLAGFELVGIDANRPVRSAVTLPVRLLEVDWDRLARDLYDSHNERVSLQLSRPTGTAQLGMSFDNPAFWFERAAG